MLITTSYTVKIHGLSDETIAAINNTIKICQNQTAYLTPIITNHWDEINQYEHKNDKAMYVEHLIHNTKNNTAQYDYDTKYNRTPSYLRRSIIIDAIANVESYMKSYQTWEKTGQTTRKPTLCTHPHQTPTFYNTGMYLAPSSKQDHYAKLKLYNATEHAWQWYKITLRGRDYDDLNKRLNDATTLKAPTIQHKNGGYVLRFAIERNVPFDKTPDYERRICAVDLGVNTPATCVIMNPDGTVLARKFIHLRREKARLEDQLARIREKRRKGARNLKKLWRIARVRNRSLSIATATAIMDFAILWSAETVVFEYLDFSRERRHCQRLAVWRARDVQERVEVLAHAVGMRFARVCAANTSRLAFDGSGRVERGDEVGPGVGYGVVRFSSGKLYNADLNAAYNIGARFFARALVRLLDGSCSNGMVTCRSRVAAKVPGLWRRSTLVLSDLLLALELLVGFSDGNMQGPACDESRKGARDCHIV